MRTCPRRYQLNKISFQAIRNRHPWIFRSHLSSAADIFSSGQWVQLVDEKNAMVGLGIYDREGLIGIRCLHFGGMPPKGWINGRLGEALEKRVQLRKFTNAFRAVHGENDGFPGVVFDVYDTTGVLQTYSTSVDRLGRFVASYLKRSLRLENIVWKTPTRRRRKGDLLRVLFGSIPGDIAVREGKLEFRLSVREGQKSGAFLDLRGLRKWVASQKWNGYRVLNLFSYTGTLGMASEIAGATEIWNVDTSGGALEFGKKYHAINAQRHRWIRADVFPWIQDLPKKERFDVIIVDPPSMASAVSQVPQALKTYKKIYQVVSERLTPKGIVIACCCTSRIKRHVFHQTLFSAFGDKFKVHRELGVEDDHPVGFPEGDYLKMLVLRCASRS